MRKSNKKKIKSIKLIQVIVNLISLLRKLSLWIVVTIIAFVLGNMIGPIIGPEIHIAPPLSKCTKIIVNKVTNINDITYEIDYIIRIKLVNKSIIPGFIDQFEMIPVVEFPIDYNSRYHIKKRKRLIYNIPYEYELEMTTRIKGVPSRNYAYYHIIIWDNCKQRIICDKDLILKIMVIDNVKKVNLEFRDKKKRELEWISPTK